MMSKNQKSRIAKLEEAVRVIYSTLNCNGGEESGKLIILQRLTNLEVEVFGETQALEDEVDTSDIKKTHDKSEEKEPVAEELRKGWIIVSPNPPMMKGTDYYYSSEDEDSWVEDKKYADVWRTKEVAARQMRKLKKDNDRHFDVNRYRGDIPALRLEHYDESKEVNV